ncbi:MAG: SpoIIE family protein phosphatase [Lentisphaeria bacterium]|nr:SpoIIE family protein phosphatase [Lentisphaeria bacterium]
MTWIITGLIVLLLIAALAVVYQRIKIMLLRSKLESAIHTNAQTNSYLNMFSRGVRQTENKSEWMSVTAKYLSDLIQADSVCVYLYRDGAFVPSGMTPHYPLQLSRPLPCNLNDPEAVENLKAAPPQDLAGLILSTALKHESLLISDPRHPLLMKITHTETVKTFIVVPMIYEKNLVGIICASNSSAPYRRVFTQEQINRLNWLTGPVILARNILEMYDRISQQQRISQELEFARNLQRSLLPPAYPQWGGFSIQAVSRAAKEVSGDFYDFVEIDSDRLLVVIGDACGKGIPACLIMAMTRSFIRANIAHFTTLKEMLFELNDNLFRDMGDGRYITLAVCLLNKKENTLEYARAGHTELIFYVRRHIRSINPNGAGLGLFPSELTEYDTFNTQFGPEMSIIMFTDGINEAKNADGEQFGIQRIKDSFMASCLAQDTPREAVAKLMDDVDKFSPADGEQDDRTVVVISPLT